MLATWKNSRVSPTFQIGAPPFFATSRSRGKWGVVYWRHSYSQITKIRLSLTLSFPSLFSSTPKPFHTITMAISWPNMWKPSDSCVRDTDVLWDIRLHVWHACRWRFCSHLLVLSQRSEPPLADPFLLRHMHARSGDQQVYMMMYAAYESWSNSLHLVERHMIEAATNEKCRVPRRKLDREVGFAASPRCIVLLA